MCFTTPPDPEYMARLADLFPTNLFIITTCWAVSTHSQSNTTKQLQTFKMGLLMSYEEDFHPKTLSNARRLASWLTLQSARTRSNVSPADTVHFAHHGVFPTRPVTSDTLVTLRLEVCDASTSHLPHFIRRPYHDVHPVAALTLSELLVVLQRQVMRSFVFSSSPVLRKPSV